MIIIRSEIHKKVTNFLWALFNMGLPSENGSSSIGIKKIIKISNEIYLVHSRTQPCNFVVSISLLNFLIQHLIKNNVAYTTPVCRCRLQQTKTSALFIVGIYISIKCNFFRIHTRYDYKVHIINTECTCAGYNQKSMAVYIHKSLSAACW
jgi:hypothetical protein